VDTLVVRHAKQGIEAEKFCADQPLVQATYMTSKLRKLEQAGKLNRLFGFIILFTLPKKFNCKIECV
jgi:hypothetical protein